MFDGIREQQRGREYWDRVVTKGLTEKLTFEQRWQRSRGINHTDTFASRGFQWTTRSHKCREESD